MSESIASKAPSLVSAFFPGLFPANWTSITYYAIIAAVVLIAVYFVMGAVNGGSDVNEPLLISEPVPIDSIPRPFDSSLLPMSTNGSEFAYSFWIFVSDWEKNYGKPKCIMYRGTGTPDEYESASPSIWFYPRENKLMVRVSTLQPEQPYDSTTYLASAPVDSRGYTVVNPLKLGAAAFDTRLACDVDSIPLQKWVHITVTVWNRALDVYVNGKVVRSCVLPGVPMSDKSRMAALHVGHGDTFNGYISRLQYFNRSVSPSEVYNMYARGPGLNPGWWNSLRNQINVAFQLRAF